MNILAVQDYVLCLGAPYIVYSSVHLEMPLNYSSLGGAARSQSCLGESHELLHRQRA